MAKLFSIAAHSSIRMQKKRYYFIFKDTEILYTSADNPDEADGLTGKFPTGSTNDHCYNVLTEFLSAFAFGADSKMIPSPGMSTDLEISLAKYRGGYGETRRIPAEEVMDEFWYVPPLRTQKQIMLSRLYREARSAHNVYMGILFFWHTLVYSDNSDATAEGLLNEAAKSLPANLIHLEDKIERIQESQLFTPVPATEFELGKYVKNGIRHSIAHIVRAGGNTRDVSVDLHSELRHLSDVESVLRYISRHHLVTHWAMKEPHDLSVFRYMDDDELSD